MKPAIAGEFMMASLRFVQEHPPKRPGASQPDMCPDVMKKGVMVATSHYHPVRTPAHPTPGSLALHISGTSWPSASWQCNCGTTTPPNLNQRRVEILVDQDATALVWLKD